MDDDSQEKIRLTRLKFVAIGRHDSGWDVSGGKQWPEVHVLDRSVHAVDDTAAPLLLKVAKQVVVLPLFVVVITIEADD